MKKGGDEVKQVKEDLRYQTNLIISRIKKLELKVYNSGTEELSPKKVSQEPKANQADFDNLRNKF